MSEHYQAVAEAVQSAVYEILTDAHDTMPDGEAGHILQGALAGLLNFWIQGDDTDDVIKQELIMLCDLILPQMRFAAQHGNVEGVAQ